MGADDSDQILIGAGDQQKKPGKVLIEEIKPLKDFHPRKSLPNVNEPEHRLISDFDEFNRQLMVAEFYLPDVRSVDEVTIEANDDQLVLQSQKHGYSFDGFLPHKINESKTQAEFDSERTVRKNFN